MSPLELVRALFGPGDNRSVTPMSWTPSAADQAWDCGRSGCIPDEEHCIYHQEEGA